MNVINMKEQQLIIKEQEHELLVKAYIERKNEVDESMQRYFGVADWAVDIDEASKLWELTEKTLKS